MITKSQLENFKKNGVLLIKNFYNYEKDIQPIQKDIYCIIGLIIKKYNLNIDRKPFSGNNFDTRFMELLKYDRKYVAEVYDAIKQIPSFIRLLSKKENEQLVQQILNSNLCGIASGGYGIRIDLPNEEKYRSFWHQEYPAQLRSLEGLVLWSPLVNILSNMGAVEVCLESHKEGTLPVCKNTINNRAGAYSLQLHDEKNIVSKYEKIAPLSKPSDLIILDWLVIHQSGINSSNNARWSMTMRYFNFLDSVGQTLSWKGSYADGVKFQDIHPELLV